MGLAKSIQAMDKVSKCGNHDADYNDGSNDSNDCIQAKYVEMKNLLQYACLKIEYSRALWCSGLGDERMETLMNSC